MAVMENTLTQIREAEAASHMRAYSENGLFQPGSWLAKPVKTVLDILPLLAGSGERRVLDLGCGVGRNAIPAAKALGGVVDCVDILPMAVERLAENAARYGVAEQIRGIVALIDEFRIGKGAYDLILAVSALEHMDSRESFLRKLAEIREGTAAGGIVCLILNSGVRERDCATGRTLLAQFEVNLDTDSMILHLEKSFENWEILKQTVAHQTYDIPRGTGTARVDTDVVTWVARKTDK